MKQVQVLEWGQQPQCIEVDLPPSPSPDEVQVKVIAAGLHPLARARASGQHYTAKGLPHVVGVDGVGSLADGQRVFFSAATTRGGSFTEIINVPKVDTVPVSDHVDPVSLAGLVNAIVASWMAIVDRTINLPKDWTVVILGATGLSGTTAIEVARIYGAGKVIGVARNTAKMEGLGLDEMVELKSEGTDYGAAQDVDVILDFLYGDAMLELMKALQPTRPVQYVQIGAITGKEIPLPAAILRSKDITIRGSGFGSFGNETLKSELPNMIKAVADGKITHGFDTVKFENIDQAWKAPAGDRVVMLP